MNKKTLNIIKLVAGGLLALAALFFFICVFVIIGQFDGNYPARINIYYVIYLLANLLGSAGLGVCGAFLILNFFKERETGIWIEYSILTLLGYGILTCLDYIILIGTDSALIWIVFILGVGGVVVWALTKFGGFDENFNKILKLVACGICFILTIIFLIGSGGIIVPLFIFALLAYMTICGILLLDILPIKTTE